MFGMLWFAVASAEAAPAIEVLRLRDAVACTELGAATPELRDELAGLTGPEVSPSWVPARAASCLVELFAADPALPGLVTPWFTDPERVALGLIVVDHVDALPAEAGLQVAQAAAAVTDARWSKRYRDRLGRSGVEEIRALAGVDAPGAVK